MAEARLSPPLLSNLPSATYAITVQTEQEPPIGVPPLLITTSPPNSSCQYLSPSLPDQVPIHSIDQSFKFTDPAPRHLVSYILFQAA